MIKRSLILIMCLLCGVFTMAQTDEVWSFSGKVVDAKTRKALSHVSVTDRSVGTVTNEDGEFTLKLKAAPTAVSFSCLGYRTQRLTAAECKALEAEGKAVQMHASSVVLSEIVVKGVDKPRELVEQAIDRIEANYPNVPNLLRGFYRETTQKRNRFISVAEGVVDVYKSPYFKMDWRDGVAILKGRRLLSQRKSDTLAVKLQGGPVLPVQLDVVKERDILLNKEELDNYHFSYKGVKQAGDRLSYVIEITPAYIVDYPLYNGRLYIDQETLAFTKIELELDMSNEEKATSSILRKKPVGLRFTPHEMSINIDYKTDDGVTRINYIRNVIRFRCDWKRKLFKSNFTITSEMVVTDRKEGDNVRPIKVRDTFNRRDNFYDKVVFFNDPGFWGDENIIEPTEDLLDGIEKIKQRLK
ncbi:MAG: carboxypeptidase-like regulatory domain-containing protein [Prevotella sp.]|nr:carboxypeptidase-like regulatory domain-containing protein [Prevotella sp.]